MADRRFATYAYEGLVIILSILIAFALDAGWADRQERRLERSVLEELRDEFRSAEARIVHSMDELEGVLAASRELLSHLGPEAPALAPATALDLTERILEINTLEVPSSVLDSVIATGQLRLISNAELRTALAEWPALVADVRENHDWHRAETDDFLVPYLARFVPLRNLDLGDGALVDRESFFDLDPRGLQGDPVFEGRLSHRMSRQGATYRESGIFLDATRAVIDLIDAEVIRR